MSAPAKAYLNKLVFKLNGSTTKDQYVAKFIFGTHQAGGYFDTSGAMQITNATTMANIKTAIQTWFHLDELLLVSHDGYTYGFIGLIKPGGSQAQYHNLGDYAQGNSRVGNYIKYKPDGQNAVEYIMLNDAGLNTRGWGNFNVAKAMHDYLFRNNQAHASAVLHVPFYNRCKFTLQFSLDQVNWYTYEAQDSEHLDGSTYYSERSLPTIPILHLPSAVVSETNDTDGTLHWRFVANTEGEGSATSTGSQTIKAPAFMYQAEYFSNTGTSGNNIPSGVANGAGSAIKIYMRKSYANAILAKCRELTRPAGDSGITPWSKGQRRAVTHSDVNLPETMRCAVSWENLYWNTYRTTAGYYLLNKNYGFQIATNNGLGYISHIFYANENETGDTPYIRLGIYIVRTNATGDGDDYYMLRVTFTVFYVNATDRSPGFDTDISFRFNWSTDGTTKPQRGVYFSDGSNTDKTVNVTAYQSGMGDLNSFTGYTEDRNLDIRSIYIIPGSMTRKISGTDQDALIGEDIIGVSQEYSRDIET